MRLATHFSDNSECVFYFGWVIRELHNRPRELHQVRPVVFLLR